MKVTADLRFAQAAHVCVSLRTRSGDRLFTLVRSVDEVGGWVEFAPTAADLPEAAIDRLPLADIESVLLTDVGWD